MNTLNVNTMDEIERSLSEREGNQWTGRTRERIPVKLQSQRRRSHAPSPRFRAFDSDPVMVGDRIGFEIRGSEKDTTKQNFSQSLCNSKARKMMMRRSAISITNCSVACSKPLSPQAN
uniref:Uncharacterized protein n=1 Tax=Timspurckia oligopyrenoides TaxID=708627 RepID=A0A7S1EPQ6_9RHOD|mmetsp:Transcript_10188/g.18341  ORF Transcript_10188/g.18341 Transcript_10188/m.18341 type:complete len:118 (+) Transcript_10188:79-432(+)